MKFQDNLTFLEKFERESDVNKQTKTSTASKVLERKISEGLASEIDLCKGKSNKFGALTQIRRRHRGSGVENMGFLDIKFMFWCKGWSNKARLGTETLIR